MNALLFLGFFWSRQLFCAGTRHPTPQKLHIPTAPKGRRLESEFLDYLAKKFL